MVFTKSNLKVSCHRLLIKTNISGLPYSLPARYIRWLEQTVLFMGRSRLLINIHLATEQEIADLNLKYRGLEKPTNILSFPSEEESYSGRYRFLGDLVISPYYMEREAEEAVKSIEFHWAHILIHGLLHLFGYDHVDEQEAEEMEALEALILLNLGFKELPYA